MDCTIKPDDVSVILTRITPENIDTIPCNLSDMAIFSSFSLENAEFSYLCVLSINKRVDFYKSMRYFKNKNFLLVQQNLATMIVKMSNRVHPNENAKEETPIDTLSYEYILMKAMCDKAASLAGDASFQFYRVIIKFDQIFDIPQTICCGLCGFTKYDLYVMTRDMKEVLTKMMKEHSTAKAHNHTLFVEFITEGFVKSHGHYLS